MIEGLISWVNRLFSGSNPDKESWREFSSLTDPQKPNISSQDLKDMASYRKDERMAACKGVDPVDIFVAYAQDRYLYDGEGRIAPATPEAYQAAPDERKVNKFRRTYRSDAKLWLHQKLADIAVDAAIDLYTHEGWKLRIYDGLRTVEAAYLMQHHAKPEWLQAGLLAKPGESAHNRALAVDSKLIGKDGSEIDEGGHFDHLNMETNSRNYSDNEISGTAKKNRLIREQAFQRAALKNGTLIAPLRSEFWDDRMPGSEKDLWRVMESVCRCLNIPAPEQKAEDYSAFAAQWKKLDKEKLIAAFGISSLPSENNILYHEHFNPLYDHDLPQPMRLSLMPPEQLPSRATGIAA